MKGTRLWQDTGSPLISGRSRQERPFWQSVFGGWVISVCLVVAAAVAVTRFGDPETIRVSGIVLPRTLALILGGSAFGVVPALLGSVSGVWLARHMGWRRPWVAGAAGGLLAGLIWLALSALELGNR